MARFRSFGRAALGSRMGLGVTVRLSTVERASTDADAGPRRILVAHIFYGGHGVAASNANTASFKDEHLSLSILIVLEPVNPKISPHDGRHE